MIHRRFTLVDFLIRQAPFSYGWIVPNYRRRSGGVWV